MKNCKIYVKDFEQFKKVQELLFADGVRWGSCGIRYITETEYNEGIYNYLYMVKNKIFRVHTTNAWERIDLPEVELVEIMTYEFRDVKKVIKVGGHSYYEHEVIEALKNIKPIN